MAIAKRSRKQIEAHITKCAESIQKNGLEIGRDLIEIRDEELWADDYESWNQYLKERAAELVGKSFATSASLIQSAEIAKRIPPNLDVEISSSHARELARLAPQDKSANTGKARDYTKIRKTDVARVIKAAGPEPSVRDIRAAVDEHLGKDRKAEAAKAKAERDRARQVDLDDYLRRIKGTSEGWLAVLQAVPADAWGDYAGEIDEAATALESLAKFLRE